MSEYVNAEHEREVTAEISARQDTGALRARCERIGASALQRTRAFGKLILFGEHFVVRRAHAAPAPAAARVRPHRRARRCTALLRHAAAALLRRATARSLF